MSEYSNKKQKNCHHLCNSTYHYTRKLSDLVQCRFNANVFMCNEEIYVNVKKYIIIVTVCLYCIVTTYSIELYNFVKKQSKQAHVVASIDNETNRLGNLLMNTQYEVDNLAIHCTCRWIPGNTTCSDKLD